MRFQFPIGPAVALSVLLVLVLGLGRAWVSAAEGFEVPPCDPDLGFGHQGLYNPTDSIQVRKFEHGPQKMFLTFWGTFKYRYRCYSSPITQPYTCHWCVRMSWERFHQGDTTVLWSHSTAESIGCSDSTDYEYVSLVMAHDAQGYNEGSHYAKIEMHPGPCPIDPATEGSKFYYRHLGDID